VIINDVEIEVQFKGIKNMHLAVYPPDGRVHVSAPVGYSEERIKMYVLQKWVWIETKRAELTSFNIQPQRVYVSGEAHYFIGQLYRLKVVRDNRSAHHAEIQGDYIVVYVHEKTDAEHIASVMDDWYKEQITPVFSNLIEKWQQVLGVKLEQWEVRQMTAKWGTCSKAKSKAIFNLQLAKKPVACVEYVVAHELTHLLERTHSDRFKRIMDQNLPDWPNIKKELNEFPI